MSLSLGIGLGLTMQRGGAGGGFDPSDISSLTSNFDLQTSDITLVSGEIAALSDASGQTTDFTQATESRYVPYDATFAGANGKPSATWIDGGKNQVWRLDHAGIANVKQITCVAQFDIGAGISGGSYALCGASGTLGLYKTSGFTWASLAGTISSLTRDGVDDLSNTDEPWGPSIIKAVFAAPITVDALGNHLANDRSWAGSIQHFMTFSAETSAGEDADLTTFLTDAWGL